jgi:hypothetical protein
VIGRFALTAIPIGIAVSLLWQASPPPAAAPNGSRMKRESHRAGLSEQHSNDATIPHRAAQRIPAKPTDTSGDPGASNWLIAIFTGFLVLVAVLQFLAMCRQSAHMRRGLKISIRQARIASRNAMAAKANADAADKTVTAKTRRHRLTNPSMFSF